MTKRFTFSALGLCLIAGAAMADSQEYVDQATPIADNTVSFKGSVVKMPENVSVNKLPAKIGETPVITEAPGELQVFEKYCIGYEYFDYVGLYPYSGTYPSTVYIDGDDVYIKNIFSLYPTNSYVKGVKDGNTIKVSLPQTIEYYESRGYGLNIGVMKYENVEDEDGEIAGTYVLDESFDTLTFTLNEDGSFKLDLPCEFDGEYLPDYSLGLVYSNTNNWTGFCDFEQVYSVFDKVMTSVPDGVELESYAIIQGLSGYLVQAGFSDGKAYIKGLSTRQPDAVVIGDIKGSVSDSEPFVVSIPQNEFISDNNGTAFIYTKVAVKNPDYNPEESGSDFYILAPEDVTYDLLYDPVEKKFTSVNPDYILCFNASLTKVYYLAMFQNFTLTYQPSYAGTPTNPINLDFSSGNALSWGYNIFYFTIPCLSDAGTILDYKDVNYSIYVDDDIIEIEPGPGMTLAGYEGWKYDGLSGPTEVVPLSFNNYWDVYKANETSVEFGLYIEGMETVGVQTVYTYGDEITTSHVVTLNIETGDVTTGVETMVGKTLETVEYYSLSGQRVAHPSDGIYVKRNVYTDGTATVEKVRIR